MGDVHKPDYYDYQGGGVKNYRRSLRQSLKGGQQGLEQLYRKEAYGTLGAQQAGANQQAQQLLTSTFGMNNPTGVSAEMARRNALQADYTGANLAAKEAARKAILQQGQALQGSKQAQANWYATLINPWLNEQSMLASLASQPEAPGLLESILGSL